MQRKYQAVFGFRAVPAPDLRRNSSRLHVNSLSGRAGKSIHRSSELNPPEQRIASVGTGKPQGDAAMTEHSRAIVLTVNGEEVRETVEARTSLVDFLRERLGLTGSHVGCEQGMCGACTVRLDDVTVRGCLVLAVQCAGARVDTIEGVSDTGEIADLQEAFVRRNALQCGFCTPGMLLSAQELLARDGRPGGRVPSRDEIRAHLSGNYCRCTGYQAIVDAVETVAGARASRPPLKDGERAGRPRSESTP
jgi:aerobic carbon-monoxide dehydrogenase small subunit